MLDRVQQDWKTESFALQTSSFSCAAISKIAIFLRCTKWKYPISMVLHHCLGLSCLLFVTYLSQLVAMVQNRRWWSRL